MKNHLILILLAALGFGTLDAAANVIPILTLTEASSTTLNWSWNIAGGGGSGALTSLGDSWSGSITGPSMPGVTDSLGSTWAEPENSAQNNGVSVNYNGQQWFLSVGSDLTGTPVHPNDGVPVTSASGSFQVAFIDNGDSTRVPDCGSTIPLLTLGLGCIGLLRAKINQRALQVRG